MKKLLLIVFVLSSVARAVPPAPPLETIPEKHRANTERLIALYDVARQQSLMSYSDLSVLVKAMSKVPGRYMKLYIDIPEIRKFVKDQRKAMKDKFHASDLSERVDEDSITPLQRLAACNSISSSLRMVGNFEDRGIYNDKFDEIYQGSDKTDKDRKAQVKVIKADYKAALKVNTAEYKTAVAKCKADYKTAMAELKAAVKAK